MEWVDTTIKVLTIVSSVVVALLGAQFWRIRSENRRVHSEADNNEASAASTVTATALSLVGPLSAKNAELNEGINAWEKYERDQRAWNLLVLREAAANNLSLPPPPDPPY